MMTQGQINGRVTRFCDQPDKLAALMEGKTDEQKRHARNHLKMIRFLRGKK